MSRAFGLAPADHAEAAAEAISEARGYLARARSFKSRSRVVHEAVDALFHAGIAYAHLAASRGGEEESVDAMAVHDEAQSILEKMP